MMDAEFAINFLQIAPFDVEIVLIQEQLQSVWLLCSRGGDQYVLMLNHCLYIDAPTTFYCDYLSLADDAYIDSFRNGHKDHENFFESRYNKFLLFHAGNSKHLFWCQKVALSDPHEDKDINEILYSETRKTAGYIARYLSQTAPPFEP